jgi:hypothetical protein
MSALSLSTLGVQCPNSRALSMASLGVFCVAVAVDFGGHQFLAFKKILDPIAGQMQVGNEVLPFTRTAETEFEIDDKTYTLVAKQTPSEIISATPDIDKILDHAAKSMGITRRKAKRLLFNEIIKELKKVETVKQSVFNDDEEIIMILVATDDL